MSTMTYRDTLVIETCCNCDITFAMPEDFEHRALRDHTIQFYCPKGHGQHFIGKTAEQKAKERADRAETRERQLADQLEATERSLRAQKGATTRIKRRVEKGVCPHCTRSFANVKRHMQTMHHEEIKAS